VVGGCSDACGNSQAIATVERAALNASGALGPFTAAPIQLLQPRRDAGGVVIGDTLYLFGGRTSGGAALATVEALAIAPDGTLGPPVAAGALLDARVGFSSVVVGDAVFAATGQGVAGDFLTTIERAPILADGSLAPSGRWAAWR